MRALVAGSILLAVLARPAAAQAVLRGRVIADSTKRPIEGAVVTIGTPERTARTDRAGRFAFDSLPGGVLPLRIRAIGFRPLELDAEIGPRDTVEADFSLTATVQELAPIEVREKAAPKVSAKMELFERHRRLGFGSFLDRSELDRWDADPVSLPLRRLAGIQLVARPSQCGGGFAAATGRGGGHVHRCGSDPRVRYPVACYLSVFVDGIRLWDPSMDDPPDIDQYLTRSLQAIEVYRGAGQLPVELQQTGTVCGAIMLWTRTGEP